MNQKHVSGIKIVRRVGLLAAWMVTAVACMGARPHLPEQERPHAGQTRVYYVAAEPVAWNYAPLNHDPVFDQPVPSPWGEQLIYPKLRYIGYTNETFTTRLPQPAWAGILGPTLHAVVGDTMKVRFLNKTDRPLSMHPHGVKYTPENEGAHYEPDGASRGIAPPGARITYTWTADQNAGPESNGPSSKVWLYHSHVMGEEEIYKGLIGTIVVTDPKRARPDGTPADVDQEYTALFMVFNENTDETPEAEQEANLKHAINGLFFGNLPGIEMRQGQRVRWYLIGLGTEVDMHTVHWHGETVRTEQGLTTDVVELLPASMRVVDMQPDNPGVWLLHCHVADHMAGGMYTRFTIR
jgi:FtsP/CotA-like multicopper oxidase with cupredoxin domain